MRSRLALLVSLCLAGPALGQQGGGGQYYDNSVGAIQREIDRYLGGDEMSSILTAGEYGDWPLDLKAGQVVLAEARSDSIDPALEIVDANGKVLFSNDDRYPGDQRPLLMWRCERDGAYKLRARSYHDKSGGQFFLRYVVSECVDVLSDKPVERRFDRPTMFWVRVPMKAGQIKQMYSENPDPGRYSTPYGVLTVSPIGLPDSHLDRGINPPIPNLIVAPVDGDYFVLHGCDPTGSRVVRIGAREIVPAKPTVDNGVATATLTSAAPLIAMSVKAGTVLEATAPDLALGAPIVISEVPDFASYDLTKPDKNPFFPVARDKRVDKGPLMSVLPGRARDSRLVVFIVKRDANVWLATNGAGAKDGRFTFRVRPAARDYPEGNPAQGRLSIGNHDYWAFDANSGDVMALSFKATTFALKAMVSNAAFDGWQWNGEAKPDENVLGWNMIARRPGRYLVALSAIGDGGGGDYALSRTVIRPKEFGTGPGAKGELVEGQTQVWKFNAQPGTPLLIHWKSIGAYNLAIRNSNGDDASLPLTRVDDQNQYGILKVDKPTTYLLVFTGGAGKASYSVDLRTIPGYVKPR